MKTSNQQEFWKIFSWGIARLSVPHEQRRKISCDPSDVFSTVFSTGSAHLSECFAKKTTTKNLSVDLRGRPAVKSSFLNLYVALLKAKVATTSGSLNNLVPVYIL